MKQDQAEIDRLDKEIEEIKIMTEKSKNESDKILNELLNKYSIFA